MTTYRPRRSASDWQELIDQQARSELSVKAFCAEHNLGYQSFQNWKSKLTSKATSIASTGVSPPAFIELTGAIVSGDSDAAEPLSSSPNWLAELDLGDGVCLRIARPA